MKKKLAIINRGVPGSGKSTFIATLREMAPEKSIQVHSTDDLLMVNGVYTFDFRTIGAKHMLNVDNFTKSLKDKHDIVICDNTNIKARDYNKYVKAAKFYGYKVVSITFYPSSITDHVARNTHNVPVETLNKMKDNLLKNLEDSQFTEEFLIYPEQGGKGSTRIKNIIEIILKSYL